MRTRLLPILCLCGLLVAVFGLGVFARTTTARCSFQDIKGKSNAYLGTFKKLSCYYHNHGEQPINLGEERRGREYIRAREALTTSYSWAVPTEAAIDCIAKYAARHGLVDFGAGTGYWSSLVEQRGVKVTAIDNWKDPRPRHLFTKVTTGSFELLPAFHDSVLLLVWPPQFSDMALKAVKTWGGQTLIYVGEVPPYIGNADLEFFYELAKHWRAIEEVPIPQWWNRGDRMIVFSRI